MSSFTQQQQQSQKHSWVSPARQNRGVASPVQDENPLLAKPQALGNQAMQRLLQTRSIQAKLAVSQPDDEYEKEADRIADRVMTMPAPSGEVGIQRQAIEGDELQPKPLASEITPLVQRQLSPEEEKKEEEEKLKVQTKPLNSLIQRETIPEDEKKKEEESLKVQRVANSGGSVVSSDLKENLNSSKGSGHSLPEDVRAFMEPRFGNDFSQVRVHTDGKAIQMNQNLNAQAFTQGRDVYFGAGKAPSKDVLTAHELTHVVQQGGTGQASTIFKQPLMVQRDPQPKNANDRMADIEKRLSDVEKQQKITEAKNKADELDKNWLLQFFILLSECRQCVLQITSGFQQALTAFQDTQTEQIQMDALWAQVTAALVTTGISVAFEPIMIGTFGKAWKETIEAIENPFNTAVQGAANVATAAAGSADVNARSTPAAQLPGVPGVKEGEGTRAQGSGAKGGKGGMSYSQPILYLSQNLGALEGYTQDFAKAFLNRMKQTKDWTLEQWEEWKPEAQEAQYKNLWDNLKKKSPDITKLKSEEEISQIVERHLWAAWIRSRYEEMVKRAEASWAYAKTGQRPGPNSLELGLGVEKKLNKLGISDRANVRIGRWYWFNSWGHVEALASWAGRYDEKVSTE